MRSPGPDLPPQVNPLMRDFFRRCHGAGVFPKEPGPAYPTDVLHPGAFPSTPYELGFWGFPCTPWAGLKREISWEEVERALRTFEAALALLRGNPPKVRGSPPPSPC